MGIFGGVRAGVIADSVLFAFGVLIPKVPTQKKESPLLPSSLLLIPSAKSRTAALPTVSESRPVIKSRRRVVARAVVIRVRRGIGICPAVIRVSSLWRGCIVALRNRSERQQAAHR